MVYASKNKVQTTIWLERKHRKAMNELAKVARIPMVDFIREGIETVLLKYGALLGDDSPVKGTAYEAAPEHAKLIAMKLDPAKRIRPEDGVVWPEPRECEIGAVPVYPNELDVNEYAELEPRVEGVDPASEESAPEMRVVEYTPDGFVDRGTAPPGSVEGLMVFQEKGKHAFENVNRDPRSPSLAETDADEAQRSAYRVAARFPWSR